MMIEVTKMNLSELVEQIALKNETISFGENEELYYFGGVMSYQNRVVRYGRYGISKSCTDEDFSVPQAKR